MLGMDNIPRDLDEYLKGTIDLFNNTLYSSIRSNANYVLDSVYSNQLYYQRSRWKVQMSIKIASGNLGFQPTRGDLNWCNLVHLKIFFLFPGKLCRIHANSSSWKTTHQRLFHHPTLEAAWPKWLPGVVCPLIYMHGESNLGWEDLSSRCSQGKGCLYPGGNCKSPIFFTDLGVIANREACWRKPVGEIFFAIGWFPCENTMGVSLRLSGQRDLRASNVVLHFNSGACTP